MSQRDESGGRPGPDQIEELKELLQEMGPEGRVMFCRRLRAAGELPLAPYPASPHDAPGGGS